MASAPRTSKNRATAKWFAILLPPFRGWRGGQSVHYVTLHTGLSPIRFLFYLTKFTPGPSLSGHRLPSCHKPFRWRLEFANGISAFCLSQKRGFVRVQVYCFQTLPKPHVSSLKTRLKIKPSKAYGDLAFEGCNGWLPAYTGGTGCSWAMHGSRPRTRTLTCS